MSHESIHLRFGSEYHQTLQDYAISQAKGIRHEDAVHDTIRQLHSRIFDWNVDRQQRAGKYKNRESLVGLVVDYLDHFADDPAETYIIQDGTPAAELSFRLELDWGPTQCINKAGKRRIQTAATNMMDLKNTKPNSLK